MKLVQNIVVFLSVTLFIGLMYISFFNVYQTDDYIYAYSSREHGIFGNMVNFYLKWGGRYFGYSINTLIPVSYDKKEILPKVYPIFLFFAFLGVLVLNFRHYFNYSIKESLTKSFLLFFFYTALLVSIPEHYFWISGSNIYFLPVILSGLLLYFLGKYQESKVKIWYWLSTLLIVVLMGSNEITALIITGLLLVFYFHKRSKETTVLLITASMFLFISFLAPGNFNRLGETTSGIIKWVKRIGVFGANAVYIFIKAILLLPLFTKVFEKELQTIRKKINFKKALLVWLVSFLPLIFTGYILNTIGRQFESVLFFYFLSSSVILLFLYKEIKKYWWISGIIIFLPETHFFPDKYSNFNIDYNLNNIVNEIFYTDKRGYETEVNERINTIKETPKDSVLVDKIKNVPVILYFNEMAPVKEEKIYINDQLEKYFNKKYIRVKE
ncbi:DUF6056 family protein [Chryseobacterium defluvii]|uniref:Dolichyl-phosphate-mannose-protein mannosyltransferase n=1 Tax=Chryseobacterium defluvii TaxID=160396 RepID=A0A495S9J5_9FLAO|nr:DUF6056 family protein [Chryseobacterium defluvii]RKS96567.1 hypothetical protein BCF58_2994 [Chryseobacterium defluvii]